MDAQVTVSAPGSIMITGEHAVVYGHSAIVAAIEQRITVRLGFIDDAVLRVTSEIAPPLETSMTALMPEGPYRFVIAAVAAQKEHLSGGLIVDIRSEIDPTLGLGSSAAITVAMLAGLAGAATRDLHSKALCIIRALQGRGSGADLAASLHGGVISYRLDEAKGAEMAPLPVPPQLSLFNVGYKTPTADVLARVAAARAANPAEIDRIYDEMGEMSAETIELMRDGDWDAIGPHLTTYQHLMKQLDVSDNALDAAVARAMVTRDVIGAKISGSGLGDCVVALGAHEGSVPKGFQPVDVAREGIVFHDNA